MKLDFDKNSCQEIYGRNLFAANFVDDEDLRNKEILDIGCGFGWFESNVVKRGVKEVVGIDISDDILKVARENIKNKKVKFAKESAAKLSFKIERFDTIVSWEVLEHIPKGDEDIFFSEAYRVLKENGIFCLSTPNDSLFAKLLDPAYILLGHRHYNIGELSKIIERNGFKIEQVEVRGRWMELLGGTNLLVAKWIFKRDMFLKKRFQDWQNKEFKKKGFAGLFLRLKKCTGTC